MRIREHSFAESMLDKTRKLRQPRFLATQYFNTTQQGQHTLKSAERDREESVYHPTRGFNLILVSNSN